MRNHFFKIVIILTAIIAFIAVVVLLQKYPFAVGTYKTISIGMQAAEGAGTETVWAPPDQIVPAAAFYVYALDNEDKCLGADCGSGGYFIECLGGWLSGYRKTTEEYDYGLREAGVDTNKHPIITVADKNAKIVGIYPGARIKNLSYIMRNHRELVSRELFEQCSNLLPSRWKSSK